MIDNERSTWTAFAILAMFFGNAAVVLRGFEEDRDDVNLLIVT